MKDSMKELIVVVTDPETNERSGHAFSRPISVGRGDTCDLRLPHNLVSRQHARIAVTLDGDVVVRDLGSSNGTLVGGRLLRGEQLTVTDNAPIEIGPYVLIATTDSVDEATMHMTMVESPAPDPTPEKRYDTLPFEDPRAPDVA